MLENQNQKTQEAKQETAINQVGQQDENIQANPGMMPAGKQEEPIQKEKPDEAIQYKEPENNIHYVLVSHDRQNGEEERYELEKEKEVTAGASPENHVVCKDEFISSTHFSVTPVNDKMLVKDLDSKNGLFLKIEEHEVQDGDILLAGKTLFRIEIKG